MWEKLMRGAAGAEPPTPSKENPNVPARLCQVHAFLLMELAAVLSAPAPAPSAPADYNFDVCTQVICRCLQHDPKERYSCLSDMSKELKAIESVRSEEKSNA